MYDNVVLFINKTNSDKKIHIRTKKEFGKLTELSKVIED